jgi:hypothetical protein
MREPPWAADLTNIPELHEIIRRRLLSKVRIFEGWCENGDRLFQVLKVHGRPLALAKVMSVAATGSPNPAFRRGTHAAHRADYEAASLDLSWDAYVARIAGRVTPYLLNAQCQHEHLPVPLDWLREQVSAGVSKCVITPAVRLEMGRRRRGE